jgi:mannose-6-phosphate isomerase-like protein (cupin superfamily)
MRAVDLTRRAWLIAGLCGVAAVAGAQVAPLYTAPRESALHVSDATLRALTQCVASQHGVPGPFSARLVADTTYSTTLIRLLKPDLPHAHAAWSEVYLIEKGSGVMLTGGTITGRLTGNSATHRSMFLNAACWRRILPGWVPGPAPAPMRPTPGDKSGTSIEGGSRNSVKPGDMVLIPAGVPHRWLKVNDSVLYLDIKFPKAG